LRAVCVRVVFGPIPQAMEHIRSGQLRALGVTTAKRLRVLPEVPALGEFAEGDEAIGWYGLSARRPRSCRSSTPPPTPRSPTPG